MQTMKVQFHIIFLHCSCIWIAFPLLGTCVPPPPPLTCNSSASSCTICNAFGTWPDRIPCRAASMVVYPSTEDEILHAVAGCVRKKLKMKVVTASSHTIPKFACPGSGDGAGILISTQRYNKEITVDKAAMTVTADSGVGLRDLLDAVAVSGLALVAAPYWEGVSLGGLLSTGSHGTSLWRRGGAVHDYVLSMRLVIPALPQEGYAKVITLNQGDPDLNAAMVSLGVLGVISKVTLTLEPQFKRSVTNLVKDDINLEEEILPFAAANEFGDLTWYSSQRRVVHRIDNRVPVTTPGNGFNDFIGFQKVSIPVTAALRATESLLEKTKNSDAKCKEAKLIIESKLAFANGLKNNEFMFTGYPVVGFQNRMQTSGSCYKSSLADQLDACPWDPRFKGLFFYETTAVFNLSTIRDFILDVKKLRDLEPNSFCGMDLYNGFLIRFLKGSSAYLGHSDYSVVIDFNYYRAKNGSSPRLKQDVWEEVEQMAFFKHGAVPHWAKNRNVAFLGAGAKYPNLGKFLHVMKKYDPDGLFSSDLTDKILLQRGSMEAKADGCALEGMCVCEEDRHCAPSEGYLCQPGKVYTEARVCRYQD